MRSLASLVQFILGFILALIILAGGSVAAALYFVTKLTALPPRPSFTNDQPVVTATQAESPGGTTGEGSAGSDDALPPNAYRAKVIWPDGLILRDRPGYEANSIGGLDFNAQVVVLETSSDNEWEKVRIEGSGQAGWIKCGNTERLN